MNIFTTYMIVTYLVVLFLIPRSITGRSLRVKSDYLPKNWYLYWNNQLNNQYGIVMSELGEGIEFLGDQESTAPTATQTTTAPRSLDSANKSNDRMNETLKGQSHIEILQECNKIKENESRDVCKRVATNPILKRMTGVRAYAASEDQFITTRGFSLAAPRLKQVICEKKMKCSTDQLLQIKKPLSLSPWFMCYEFDPNRFPQWLNTARCVCEGCINATTGKEDKRHVFSRQFFVDVSVLRKESGVIDFTKCTKKTCREDVESIAIGCHCQYWMWKI